MFAQKSKNFRGVKAFAVWGKSYFLAGLMAEEGLFSGVIGAAH